MGYMQDRLNARLMAVAPTAMDAANPSLTCDARMRTRMLAGSYDPAEIIASVTDGLYAANFGGGQVDSRAAVRVFDGGGMEDRERQARLSGEGAR